jgi:hypothetical protein
MNVDTRIVMGIVTDIVMDIVMDMDMDMNKNKDMNMNTNTPELYFFFRVPVSNCSDIRLRDFYSDIISPISD